VFVRRLIDGFERATLAELLMNYLVTEGSITSKLQGSYCSIDSEGVDCEKARQFIDEHMKN
jgi:hypothetical protein